jgi:Cu/Ag efflux protein CusF
MERSQRTRWIGLLGATLCLLLFLPVAYAQERGKKEYVFRGTVEKVDAKAKTLTVNNEKIEGWMTSMSMNYGVDNPEVIGRVKVGDHITAKVYEGDFMKLYGVKVVVPPPPTLVVPPRKK